jgi:hypothetical protein
MSFITYIRKAVVDGAQETFASVVREFDLFLGNALLLIGLLSFESDKFCDGNTADYLSCTRPSTYYYFDYLDIFLIVVGSTLVIAWFLKQRR